MFVSSRILIATADIVKDSWLQLSFLSDSGIQNAG